MKKRINKFAYPCDIEPQKLCLHYPKKRDIFVGVEIDPTSALCVETYDNGTRKISGDFLGLDGVETKEVSNPPTLRFSSDVRLILHAKDLAKRVGADVVSRMLERVGKASAFQQQLDGLTDRQLLDAVRSRHIQAPSEIKSYSEILIEEAQQLNEQYEAQVAEAKAKAQAEAQAKQTPQAAAPAAAE